jgi:exopolyphosphatase/guanosine-5'-triphosphate,3'-diphosphate pyrophosphatase
VVAVGRYAVIDVGSNTVRLCAYDVPKKKSARTGKPRKIFDVKESIGLSAFVEPPAGGFSADGSRPGVMTQAGIDAAAKAVKRQVRRAQVVCADQVWVFATAALRNCANSDQAVAAVEEESGARVDVLSGEEEARLGLLGARLAFALDEGVLIDVGGGSTEVTRLFADGGVKGKSIPMGSLSSYRQFVDCVIPTKAEIERIGASFRLALEEAELPVRDESDLFGMGGSVRAAARVYGDLCNGGIRSNVLVPEQVDAIISYCEDAPGPFAHGLLRVCAQRVHTLVPGCAIIREVFRATGAQRMTIDKCGVREGYLLDRISRL